MTGINFPDIESVTLKNGIELVVAKSDSLPIIDVSIRMNTGNTADDLGTQGLSDAMFILMDKGTRKYDAGELAAERDKIAMGVRMGAGTEQSSMSYQILTTYLDESLQVAAEILRNPTFPDDETEKFRQQVLAFLATIERNPAGNAIALFNRAVFGPDHPLGGLWTSGLVNGLSQENLQAFHDREIAPDNMTVFMIGDIDIATAKTALEKSFGNWKAKNDSHSKPVGDALQSVARVILVHQPEAVQSRIVVGHSIPRYDAETNTELTVVNAVFGGDFEARINMNLREDKGWSYGIGSGVQRNSSGEQSLIVSGSVQTDKTMESMMEIKREFDDFLSSRPATDAELDRVKQNRTRSLPGRFATKRGFLQSMMASDAYGLPYDYAESTAIRIDAVSLEGVNDRARSLMRPDEMTWVIIGDLSQIEDQVRSLNYGEVEVWDGFGIKLR